MSGWTGLAPVAARIGFCAAIALAAIGLFVQGGRRRGRRVIKEAKPCRRGEAALADLLERSRKRPWSRDLAAQSLRVLARDAAALRLGLDEAQARASVERGLPGADPRLGAFLGEDQLAPGARQGAEGGGEDFLDRFEEALLLIEDYGSGRQGE